MNQTWQSLSIDELETLFRNSDKPFWISGGHAIDLFLGKNTRPHEDLDVSIKRTDQLYFQKLLIGWNLQASDPPGSGKLRKWEPGETLSSPVHNVWCGKVDSWNLELLLCEFEGDEWIYRRNPKIRGPIAQFGWTTTEGTRVIAPEIQLLYKSKSPRAKDNRDFENCLHVLNSKQRDWLRLALIQDSENEHPWLKSL